MKLERIKPLWMTLDLLKIAEILHSVAKLQPVHVPRKRRKPKLWFVLELMHDERTDPSMYPSTEAWFVRHRLYPE